jgi:hypothetical protein
MKVRFGRQHGDVSGVKKGLASSLEKFSLEKSGGEFKSSDVA